jgi:hypothetical protein
VHSELVTHPLDGNLCQYVNNPILGDEQKLTRWMGFHSGMSKIQIEPWRCTVAHQLDEILLAY